MIRSTFIAAAALIALGVLTYFTSDSRSPTALIPAFLGLPLAAAGAIALKPGLKMHAMHAGVLLALLGVLGGLGMGVPKGIAWAMGTTPERPVAVRTQLIMGVICLWLMITYVRSFIAARKARQTPALNPQPADPPADQGAL